MLVLFIFLVLAAILGASLLSSRNDSLVVSAKEVEDSLAVAPIDPETKLDNGTGITMHSQDLEKETEDEQLVLKEKALKEREAELDRREAALEEREQALAAQQEELAKRNANEVQISTTPVPLTPTRHGVSGSKDSSAPGPAAATTAAATTAAVTTAMETRATEAESTPSTTAATLQSTSQSTTPQDTVAAATTAQDIWLQQLAGAVDEPDVSSGGPLFWGGCDESLTYGAMMTMEELSSRSSVVVPWNWCGKFHRCCYRDQPQTDVSLTGIQFWVVSTASHDGVRQRWSFLSQIADVVTKAETGDQGFIITANLRQGVSDAYRNSFQASDQGYSHYKNWYLFVPDNSVVHPFNLAQMVSHINPSLPLVIGCLVERSPREPKLELAAGLLFSREALLRFGAGIAAGGLMCPGGEENGGDALDRCLRHLKILPLHSSQFLWSQGELTGHFRNIKPQWNELLDAVVIGNVGEENQAQGVEVIRQFKTDYPNTETGRASCEQAVAVSQAERFAERKANRFALPFAEIETLHKCFQAPQNTQITADDIVFLVMASSGAKERVLSQRATWAGDAPHVFFFSDVDDPATGLMTIPELKNRGSYDDAQHRQLRGLQWLSREHAALMKKPWFFTADDDTWINLPNLLRMASSLRSDVPTATGFVWTFGTHLPLAHISGGGGQLLSNAAIAKILPNLYATKCPHKHLVDDTLAWCEDAVGVLKLHSSKFHWDEGEFKDHGKLPMQRPLALDAVTGHYLTPEEASAAWAAVTQLQEDMKGYDSNRVATAQELETAKKAQQIRLQVQAALFLAFFQLCVTLGHHVIPRW